MPGPITGATESHPELIAEAVVLDIDELELTLMDWLPGARPPKNKLDVDSAIVCVTVSKTEITTGLLKAPAALSVINPA